MLLFKSRDHDGAEIIINKNSIRYALPTLDGNTVVYFDDKNFIVVIEKFDSFKKKVLDAKPDKIIDHSAATTTATASLSTPTKLDPDTYPDHLPRLPTGNVDKRTNAYKEWVASQETMTNVQV